ncbi:MAG: GGDEF domain-containing protein [Succinivibrio sp.]
MELLRLCNTNLLYYAIGCVLVLIAVLKNENTAANATSKVNGALSRLLLVHGVCLSIYALLSTLREYFGLENNAVFTSLTCIFGFMMGYVAFVYPYFTYYLLKKFVFGKSFLSGAVRKALFVIFVATSVFYLFLAFTIIASYAVSLKVPELYLELIMVMPTVAVIFYLVCLKDLHCFIREIIKDSIISERAGYVFEFVTVIGPILTIHISWCYNIPLTYSLLVVFVFMVQLVSQDRAVSLDFLTGLNNRKELLRYLTRLFEKVDDLDHNLNLIFIDINDFKGVNDTYGHSQGDKALLAVSSCLKKAAINKDCFICRYAGDEFTVVIKNTTINNVDNYCSSLNEQIKQINDRHEYPFELSLSLGVVKYSEQFVSADEFIAAADAKMYLEKQAHKQRKSIL